MLKEKECLLAADVAKNANNVLVLITIAKRHLDQQLRSEPVGPTAKRSEISAQVSVGFEAEFGVVL